MPTTTQLTLNDIEEDEEARCPNLIFNNEFAFIRVAKDSLETAKNKIKRAKSKEKIEYSRKEWVQQKMKLNRVISGEEWEKVRESFVELIFRED